MVRKFVFMKRKPGMEWSAFSEHWRSPHAKLIADLPEFWTYTARYIQNHVRPEIPNFTREPLWDGVVECWEKPQGNYLRGFTEEPAYMAVVRPDEPKFIQIDKSVKLFAEEKVIIDGPREGVKLLVLARRDPKLSVKEFQDYWYEEHGIKVRNNSDFSRYAKRYVQHHVMPKSIRSLSGHAGYDGIVELWFGTIADAMAAFSSPSYLKEIRADERRFVADPPSPRLVVDEIVIPAP